jgi:hypothetical protein
MGKRDILSRLGLITQSTECTRRHRDPLAGRRIPTLVEEGGSFGANVSAKPHLHRSTRVRRSEKLCHAAARGRLLEALWNSSSSAAWGGIAPRLVTAPPEKEISHEPRAKDSGG